jgi:hypothetical protein
MNEPKLTNRILKVLEYLVDERMTDETAPSHEHRDAARRWVTRTIKYREWVKKDR